MRKLLCLLLLAPLTVGSARAYFGRNSISAIAKFFGIEPSNPVFFHDNITRLVFNDESQTPCDTWPACTTPVDIAILQPLVIDQNAYPDLYKFASFINITGTIPVAFGFTQDAIEAAHQSPDGVLYWNGNETDWEAQAVFNDYPSYSFQSAYQDMGYFVHLEQDSTVPAHSDRVFHGLGSLFLSYANLPSSPEVTFRTDNFELLATQLTWNDAQQVTEAQYWSAVSAIVPNAEASCSTFTQYWLPGIAGWGWYGFLDPNSVVFRYNECGAVDSADDFDRYPNDVGYLDSEIPGNVTAARVQTAANIAKMGIYLAAQKTHDALIQLSEQLPPLLKVDTTAIVANFSQGATVSFNIAIQENRSSSVNLVIQDTVTGRYLRATVNSVAQNLDLKSSVGLNAQDINDKTVLPYANSLTITWDGSMTDGGSLAEGPHFLSVMAIDGDGNVGFGAGNIPVTVTAGGPAAPAQVSLSCGSFSFPSQVIHLQSNSMDCNLSNNSGTALTNLTLTISGDDAGDFAAQACDNSVNPYNDCDISVSFTPGATGSRTATLAISADELHPPLNVALGGIGQLAPGVAINNTDPALGLTTVLDFGTEQIGSNTAAQTIKVTNTGQGPLIFIPIGASYVDYETYGSNEFPASGCDQPVAPQDSCTIGVSFAPLASGFRQASLDFSTNLPYVPPDIELSGTGKGVGAQSSVSTNTLTLPNTEVGASSAPRTVTVSNPGTVPLTVRAAIVPSNAYVASFSNTGDFTESGCSSSLGPGGSCQISVVFQPSALGQRVAGLQIYTNEAHNPDQIYLTGNGAPAVPVLSPTSLDFGIGGIGVANPGQTVTLTNPGPVVLTVQMAIGGANPKDFTQQGCTAFIGPDNSCTILVRFTPTVTGARSGTLLIGDGAQGSPQAVTLTGTGEGVAEAVLGARSLDFGDQAVGTSGTSSVNLKNSGSGLLGVSVSITGPNAGDFSQSGCNFLNPGQNCDYTITFTPSGTGMRTATLVFNDDAANSPQMVTLMGNGVPAPPTSILSTNDINFGSQAVGTTSTAQNLVINDIASGPLSVILITITGANLTDFALLVGGQNMGDFSVNSCGGPISNGNSCTVSVGFTPSASGDRSATMTVFTSSGNYTLALEGTGI